MIEYRREKVLPQYEQFYIQNLCAFGYKYDSSREIYDNSLIATANVYEVYYDHDGRETSRTQVGNTFDNEKTNYVVMIFSRDTTIPHYDELRSLEAEWNIVRGEFNSAYENYLRAKRDSNAKYSSKVSSAKATVFLILGIGLGVGLNMAAAIVQSIFVFILGIGAMIGFLIASSSARKKINYEKNLEKQRFNANIKQKETEAKALLKKADAKQAKMLEIAQKALDILKNN